MKNLSRRSFLKGATGAAGIGLLAACAPVAAPADSGDMGADEPDEMVAELEMWTEMATVPWLGAMDEIVESFNSANPGIHVTHSGFSGLAYEQATKTAFAGGAVPDFLQTDAGPGALSAFIEADQLLDLTDVVEENKGAIYPDALDSVLYKGRYWGAPWAMTVANLMYYNADILAEHGVDPATLTTWSAFTDACQTFQDAGVTPVLIGAKNAWPGGHWAQHLYIRTFGVKGSVDLFLRGLDVNHESPLRFTDPAGVRVWELIKELLDNDYYARGVLSDDYPAAFGKLFRGDGAFFQTGGWLLGEWFAQENPQIDLQFMLMPAIDDIAESNADEVSFNARTLIVPKDSAHPAEAQVFVKWYLQSEDPHRIWYKHLPGEAPPMPLTSPMENLRPESSRLIDLLNNAPALTIMIERAMDYNIGQEILWHGSSGVLSGALSPVEAAERAENLVLEWREARM